MRFSLDFERNTTTFYQKCFEMSIDRKNYKIVLVGDCGVGKTTFVKRHLTGEFEAKHVCTLGVEVHPLKFRTNYGEVTLNVWDVAGNKKYVGLKEGYFVGSQGAIVMGDASKTTNESVDSMFGHFNDLRATLGDEIPTILCLNKCDSYIPKVDKPNPGMRLFRREGKGLYVSAKSNYNYEKPFIYLLRKMTGKSDLEFIPESEF